MSVCPKIIFGASSMADFISFIRSTSFECFNQIVIGGYKQICDRVSLIINNSFHHHADIANIGVSEV